MKDLFEVFFLSGGEVEHLFGVFDQNRAFGLRLRDIEATCKDDYLRLVHALDHTYKVGISRYFVS